MYDWDWGPPQEEATDNEWIQALGGALPSAILLSIATILWALGR